MSSESDMIGLLKQRYDFESWAGRRRLDESLFVRDHLLSARAVGSWELLKTDEIKVGDMPKRRRSLWVRPGGGPEESVRVDTYECESLERAHEFLIHILGTFHSPFVQKRDDLPLGDVVFAPPGEASVAFVRANVVFVISRAGRGDFSVVEFARQIDDELISKPEESETPPARLDLSLTPAAPVGLAALRVAAAEGGDAAPIYLKFFSPTGELAAEGDQLIYRSMTDAPPEISVYSVDAEGRAARRVLRADDELVNEQ